MKKINILLPPRKRRDLTVMMAVNEISRLFKRKIHESDRPDSAMSQDSFRLILIELSHHDGITQLELSNYTHLKPPTISITVGKMEALGYVTRVQDEKDMRSYRVFLTPKGRKEHNDHLANIKSIEKDIISELTEDENELLMDILMKMRKKLYYLNGIEYCENEEAEKRNEKDVQIS